MPRYLNFYEPQGLVRVLSRCSTRRLNTSIYSSITTKSFQISASTRQLHSSTSLKSIRDAIFVSRSESINTWEIEPLDQTISSVTNKYDLLRILDDTLTYSRENNFGGQWFLEPQALLEALTRCHCTKYETIQMFNAIMERCRSTSTSVPRILYYHAMKAAATGNFPTAIWCFLQSLHHRPGHDDSVSPISLGEWISIGRCILVANNDFKHLSWDEIHQKKAWAKVITGDHLKPEYGQIGLYHFFNQYGVAGLSHWFTLVMRFCSSEDVLQHWIQVQKEQEKNRYLTSGVVDLMVNSSLQILLAKKDPKRAWQMVSLLGPTISAINNMSWKQLLYHPEYLQTWNSVMEKPVMERLEDYLKDIERNLSIDWIGGEEGYHVLKHNV